MNYSRISNFAQILLFVVSVTLTAQSPVKLSSNQFKFTEGPVWDGNNTLYFTDIPNSKVIAYKLDSSTFSTAYSNSNKANGLMLSSDNKLLVCEGDLGKVTKRSINGVVLETLADKYQGKRFNKPNDLCVDAKGGIYFTDPTWGMQYQSSNNLYYRNKDGIISSLDAFGNDKPNGVIISPNGKFLYVNNSWSTTIYRYTINENTGAVSNRINFATIKDLDNSNITGADGMAVDTQGNLYVTAKFTIQIFNSQGNKINTINFPEKTTNCTFGGRDKNILFVTAGKNLYKVDLPTVKGFQHPFDFLSDGGGNNSGNPEKACNTSAQITGLTVTSSSKTSISLAFDNLVNVNTYEIRTFNEGTYSNNLSGAIKYNAVAQSPVNITGLQAGKAYTFVIRAICSGGGGTTSLFAINGSTKAEDNTGGNGNSGVGDSFFIVNKQTGKKLRPQSNADGVTLIQVDASTNDNFVKWERVNTSNGYFYLKNVSTGKYFRPVGDTDGSALEQRPTSYSGNYTQWRQVATSGGYFYLQNKQTNLYFRPSGDGNNSSMVQRPTSYSGNYTQWTFQNTSAKLVSSTKAIQIKSNPITNGVLELINNQKSSYEITTLLGKKIQAGEVSSTIDISKLNAGVYIVRFVYDGNIQIEKIIINQ